MTVQGDIGQSEGATPISKLLANQQFLSTCYTDLNFANHAFLPSHFNKDTPDFHLDIIRELKARHKFHGIVAPRGHSKSTLITLGYVMHRILFRQAHFIVIVSDTLAQSKLFLEAIKMELEDNDYIKEVFGDLKGRKWGEEDIITSTGIRILVRGAQQKVRGLKYRNMRPDLFVIDDLENDEAVETKEQRFKLESWFNKALIPALSDDGRIVYVGTILHDDSLLNKIVKGYEAKAIHGDENAAYSEWFVQKYAAIQGFDPRKGEREEDGTPLFPSRFSMERLLQIKRNFIQRGKADAWASEYMNDPVSESNASFKREDMRHYDAIHDDVLDQIEDGRVYTFITTDLAISKRERADYSVIKINGVDEGDNWYTLEIRRGRWNPFEFIEQLFDAYQKWKPNAIGIETVAYQKAMVYMLRAAMDQRKIYLPLVEVPRDLDKPRRISALGPRYRMHKNFHLKEHYDFEEELLRFPKGAHDDILDCEADMLYIASPPPPLPKKRDYGWRTPLADPDEFTEFWTA